MSTNLDAHRDLITQLYCNHHLPEDEIQNYLKAENGVISESVNPCPQSHFAHTPH